MNLYELTYKYVDCTGFDPQLWKELVGEVARLSPDEIKLAIPHLRKKSRVLDLMGSVGVYHLILVILNALSKE